MDRGVGLGVSKEEGRTYVGRIPKTHGLLSGVPFPMCKLLANWFTVYEHRVRPGELF